jgi:hypothetical protein
MKPNIQVLRGFVRGRIIELTDPPGFAEGSEVFVAVAPINVGMTELQPDEADELAKEIESEQALETSHRMRHTERSVREL